jgi:hypothetical protein
VVHSVLARATANALASMDLSLDIQLSGGLDPLPVVAQDLSH